MLVNLSTDPGIDDVRCVQLTGKQGLVDTNRLTGWSSYLVDSRVSGQVNKHDSVCWKVQDGRCRMAGSAAQAGLVWRQGSDR